MEKRKTEYGVLVPVCDSCLKGEHKSFGMDHRVGIADDRGDCKNSEGSIQCCCGMGGYVYNPEKNMLVKGGHMAKDVTYCTVLNSCGNCISMNYATDKCDRGYTKIKRYYRVSYRPKSSWREDVKSFPTIREAVKFVREHRSTHYFVVERVVASWRHTIIKIDPRIECGLCHRRVDISEISGSYKSPVCNRCARDFAHYGCE